MEVSGEPFKNQNSELNRYLAVIAALLFIHLWRFPNLVMSNGGGAFFILYLLCLLIIAFPLALVEKVIRDTVGISLKERLMTFPQTALLTRSVRPLVRLGGIFKSLLQVGFYQFFFFIATLSVLQWGYWVRSSPFDMKGGLWPPGIDVRGAVTVAMVLGMVFLQKYYKHPFLLTLIRVVILTSFSILLIVYVQALSIGSQIEGLKNLFYPDFSALNKLSFLEAIGHALLSLGIGLGWNDRRVPKTFPRGPLTATIQLTILAAFLAIFTGLLVIPMTLPVQEAAFGVEWIFFTLPRWVSYSTYGVYYCTLYFIALFFLSFFLCLQIVELLQTQWGAMEKRVRFIFFNGLLSLAIVIVLFPGSLSSLWAESILKKIDSTVINGLFPVQGLLLVVFMFSLTWREQQKMAIMKNETFFGSEVFYSIWKWNCLVVIPAFIGLAWVAAIF